MNLDEQLAFFDKNIELAFERTLQVMVEYRNHIIARARHRLVSGFYEYGDKSWGLSPEQLLEELLQELADAPVYQVMRQHSQAVKPRYEVLFEADPQLERALAGGPDD